MALIQCSECGASVSDKAVSCPHCGAPPKATKFAPPQKPLIKKRNPLVIGCAVLFGIGAFGLIVGGLANKNGGGNEAAADANATAPEKSAEDKAQNKRAEMAGIALASLQAAVRDPDSFKLERAFTTMDAKYACIRYRARNGFGGMNREHVVFTARGGDQSASAWNRHCVVGDFSEQTSNAETLAGAITRSQ